MSMTRCFLSRTTVCHTAQIYKGLVGSLVASVSATRQELVKVTRAIWRMQQRIQLLFNFLVLEGYTEEYGTQATTQLLLLSDTRPKHSFMLTSSEARPLDTEVQHHDCKTQRLEVQETKQIMAHKRRSSVPTEFSTHLLALPGLGCWCDMLQASVHMGQYTSAPLHLLYTLLRNRKERCML